MIPSKELHEFQEIDTEIGAKAARLVKINQELDEDAEVKVARGELDSRQERLRSLESDQKSFEEEIDNTRNRIASQESRMYGNQVGNPRDLQSIVKELEHLKKRQQELEDSLLGLMEEVEAAGGEAVSQQDIVEELHARWASTQGHLIEEKTRIEAEMPGWKQKRLQHAASIPEPALRIYERLLAVKGGLAVATVERGACMGCRIALPTRLVQQARAGKELTYCSSCGRLLFAS